MKHRLKPLAISLCLLGAIATPTFATAMSDDQNQALVQKVDQLQQEILELKKQLKPHHKAGRKHARQVKHAKSVTTYASVAGEKQLVGVPITTRSSDDDIVRLSKGKVNNEYFPVDFDVPGQSLVSTGPYLGTNLQYSGSNLIINNPSVNTDVALLNVRKGITERMVAMGRNPEEQNAHVLLSGVVEGQANYKSIGGGSSSSDIDLTSVGIDAYILGPSTWVSGLISLSYDNNSGAQTGSLNNNSRSESSRVFVKKAFLTIGDFAKSPFYGTVGQLYVPFGTYSSAMVSSPLTKALARTQARAIVLGFQQQTPNAFYGSVYTFRGDSRTATAKRINNGGLNAGYRFKGENVSGNFGAGVIANIADSQGMQDTGNGPAFGGFGGTNGSGREMLVHRVPAYNLRGSLSLGSSVDVLAEYITAARRFSPADMTMNGHGAKPQALNLEASYSFQGLAKPLSLGVGYGMTKDALALGLPENRYSAVLNTSLWKNTLQSLEFRHDVNYRSSSIATGSGIAAPSASGKSDNAIFAQMDIYF